MTRRFLIGALLCTCAAQGATAHPWRKPWVQPHDPRQAARASDAYAWRLFVALNWPAKQGARTADPHASLGADVTVVWETWQSTADVYLSDGRDPGPWLPGRAVSPIADEQQFETASLKDSPNPRHIVQGRMVPLIDPLADAKRITAIRMNRTAFNYIRAQELYCLEGQIRAIGGSGVHFPPGSTEIKSKWRPIRADEQGRYHTVTVRLGDGSERLYGLTALHIVSKDLPQWFWATFEQVDNPSLADGEGWQLPSSDRFACRGERADCNRAPPGIGLAATVWQFYRLRGTLTGYVDEQNQSLKLANSELEAGFQKTSSCMTCHARAALAVSGDMPVRLPVFDVSGPNQGTPGRRGYLGLPLAEWFGASGDGTRTPFRSLDFVWSLSMAQPRSGS